MRAGEVYEHPGERWSYGSAPPSRRAGNWSSTCTFRRRAGSAAAHPPRDGGVADGHRGKSRGPLTGREWKVLGPGDSLHVPPNTSHSWRPVGEDVRILGGVRPGTRFEENWRQFRGLSQDGKLGPNGGSPAVPPGDAPDTRVPGRDGAGRSADRSAARACGGLRAARRGSAAPGRDEEYLDRGPSEIVQLEPLPV